MLGQDWLPVRRFGARQKNKTRPIDDFRENTLNQTFGSVEKPELRTMDHVLWALVILAQYFTFHEHISFFLSDGTVLNGEVHAEWKKLNPIFKTTCVDLQSAYKLAVAPAEQKRTVVTLWDRDKGEPVCYVSRVLPFGASASVHHFLRVSAFLHASGLRTGLCWAAYFDDFAILTHECHEKSSLHPALGLFEILGFQYSTYKLSPFSDVTELLGVEIDFLGKMLSERVLVVSEMPSKLGKLQYAEAQLWGRAGRLALADLRRATGLGKNQVTIDDRACKAIQLLLHRLSCGKPRTLRISKKNKPVILFTDGSLETEHGRAVARIGGVCISTEGTFVFGAEAPNELLNVWREGGEKEHVIGLVELYAVLVAMNTWSHLITGERLLIFVDNWPVLTHS